METTSNGIAETADLAKRFLPEIGGKKGEQATILALAGDLGSGKTTFTQCLAKELGVAEYVTSPTFVIEKKYKTSSGAPFANLIHIDCYRILEAKEMLKLDWEEIIADPANLIVVEWPERIKKILPENIIWINFEFIGENERRIRVNGKE